MKNEQQYEAVRSWPKKEGKRELLEYLSGEPVLMMHAIKAKCYECCVGDDGGCTVTICPLYPYSQFNETNEVPVIKKNLTPRKRKTKK